MIVALLLACARDPADTGAGDTDPVLVAEDLVPELAPDDVPALFSAALRDDAWLPTDVYTWVDALLDDLEQDPFPLCHRTPSDQPGWTTFALPDGCMGTKYRMGGALFVSQEDRLGDFDRHVQSVHLYSAYGELVDGSGEVTAGGNAALIFTISAGSMTLNAKHGGSFADPSAEDTLRDGVSGNVIVDGTLHREAGEFEGTLEAAFGGATAIALRDLAFGPGCPAPTGEVRLRDPSSGWWTVALADDCSGCGELRFGDAGYGEVCVGADVKRVVGERLAAFASREAP